MSNLKVKAVRGGMFMAVITVAMRPISMALAIILARLLAPEDFGLLALAMLVINASNYFTDLGMRPTVVQSKHDIHKVSYYAFVIVMVTSIAFTMAAMLLAKPLAEFVSGGTELVPVLRWMTLYVTLEGLWVIPEAMLKRNLQFKELGLVKFPSELSSTIISIPLALAGYGVWSLVIGYLLGQITKIVLIWWFARPWIWLRPQKWDREIVESMFRFGIPSMIGGLTKFLQNQVDTFIVGRRLGPASVGIYSKAFSLTTRMADMLTAVIFTNVMFPSYARIQDDKPRLTRAYLLSNSLVTLIIMPVAIGLAITAPMLVPIMLGPQWTPMIPLWQIFSLYGLTRPISTNSSPLFSAVGQPRRNLSASLVILAVMVPALLLLIDPYGATGAAVAVSLASVVAMLFNVYQVNQILPGTAWKTLLQSLPILLAGGLMALGVLLLQGPIIELAGGENLVALSLIVAVAALIYLAAILVLQGALVRQIYDMAIKALGMRWVRLLPARLRPSK